MANGETGVDFVQLGTEFACSFGVALLRELGKRQPGVRLDDIDARWNGLDEMVEFKIPGTGQRQFCITLEDLNRFFLQDAAQEWVTNIILLLQNDVDLDSLKPLAGVPI